MSTLKFVEKEPEEGTPTLGVVYHVTRQWEIRGLTGFEPIGWVVEEEPRPEEEGLGYRIEDEFTKEELTSILNAVRAVRKSFKDFQEETREEEGHSVESKEVSDEQHQKDIQMVLDGGVAGC